MAGPDFCFIFAPDGYDEPDILRSPNPRSVSWVLMPDKIDMPQARELAFVESGTPQARAVERGDGDGVQVRILEIRALKPAVLEADIADPRAAEIRFLCPAFP